MQTEFMLLGEGGKNRPPLCCQRNRQVSFGRKSANVVWLRISLGKDSSMVIRIVVTALLLAVGFATAAADLRAGVEAFRRGDHVGALREIRPLVRQGNASAQFMLGILYQLGSGVDEDYHEAARWYRRSADQGHADAQHFLGSLYAGGKGVPQNYQHAGIWYRKAAEQGLARAQYDLASLYVLGWGVPRDVVQGYAWFNLAATRGDEGARQHRNKMLTYMTPSQIARAQALSLEINARLTPWPPPGVFTLQEYRGPLTGR
ncbi:MAG: tetratricopeptide repeat protein [Gemmatimonadota bacterium]|nr:tetratricopeptide repeat protein [Gemmatimonadota bacterium]